MPMLVELTFDDMGTVVRDVCIKKLSYPTPLTSQKWRNLDRLFKKEVRSAKSSCYQKFVSELKIKKPGQWYSCLKRITSYDQLKNEKVNVDELNHLPDQVQAEKIAENFAAI